LRKHHEALRRNVDQLLSRDGVYAVGLGEKVSGGKRTGKRAIICSIKKKKSRMPHADRIPTEIDGIPTDIVEIGSRPIAFPAYQDMQRPVVPGCSVGHVDITTGTIGGVVEVDGEVMLLSNNHVFADENKAELGDGILQPGPYDGGGGRIGTLYTYVPISFVGQTEPTPDPGTDGDPEPPIPDPDPEPPTPDPEPPVEEDDSDCFIANIFANALNAVARLFGRETQLKPVRPRPPNPTLPPMSQDVTAQTIRNRVDGALMRFDSDVSYSLNYLNYYDGVKGVNELAGVGTSVHKLGRTTGHTTGTITQTNVTVDVGYGTGVARFENQTAIESGVSDPFSAGGDSGSIIVDDNDNAVALLFAGNDVVTFANNIDDVVSELNITRFTGT
jgi:hypothetical protein